MTGMLAQIITISTGMLARKLGMLARTRNAG